MMSFIGKKFRSLAIACLAVLASLALLFGLAACKPDDTQKEVSLVNWKDETIEVEWNAEVPVSNSAAYDTDGNAYAVIAQVTQADGAPPAFVFFVNNPELSSKSFRRRLENLLRDMADFSGVPIKIFLRSKS